MQDICIIGGGAAGMAAAITAIESNSNLSICIVEKREDVGKKLLATGNGRCNITNRDCDEYAIVADFLTRHGIMLREEAEGRMYPYSEQAASVVDLLKHSMKALNIKVLANNSVLSIERNKTHGFDINIDRGKKPDTIACRRILIACGGKAAPQFGTSGDGYTLAKNFGHGVSKIYPILMPLECEGISKELKGIRAKCRASLIKDEMVLAEETGEIQFTDDGLSGICIFNLTRYLKLDEKAAMPVHERFRQYSIKIDLLPQMETCEVIQFLKDRRLNMANLSADKYLYSIVNTKIAEMIVRKCSNGKNETVGDITSENIEKIAKLLKNSRLTVTGAKGWKEAQCTGGGISLEKIDSQRMESNLENGVFFAGEILDYDGPCGGYNLHNAWLTGIKAGNGLAMSFTETRMIGE